MSTSMDFSKKKRNGNRLSPNVIAAGLVVLAVLVTGGVASAGKIAEIQREKKEAEMLTQDESYQALSDAVQEEVYQYFYTNDIGDMISVADRDALVSLIMRELSANGILQTSLSNTQQLEVENMLTEAINKALTSNNIEVKESIEEYQSIITKDLEKYFENKISEEIAKQLQKNTSDIADLKSYIATLQSQVNSQSTVTNSQKEELTELINSLTSLTNQQKNDLLNIINENGADTSAITERLNAYINNLESQLGSTNNALTNLSISSASSLEEINGNLTSLINANTSLTEETKTQLLELINSNKDTSEEGLQNLYDELMGVISSASELSASEREALGNSLSALENSTASSITSLDTKYAKYYEQTFNIAVPSTQTFESEIFKPSSNVSLVYDQTSGFTVTYELGDGFLKVITKATAEGGVSSVSGTMYIDNSMDNATETD